MASALSEVGSSRRSVFGRGAEARDWFGSWGATIDPSAPLLLHADVIDAPGLRVARVWHTAARIGLPRRGVSTALLPLEGRLRIESGADRDIGALAPDTVGILGGDGDHVLVTETPTSWIGIHTIVPLGIGLIAPDQVLILEDPDDLLALAVQIVNTVLSRPARPSASSLAQLHLIVSSVIDNAALGAHDRQVHQATGMVIAQTRTTPAQALDLLRAHAAQSGSTVREVAGEILARRLDFTRRGTDTHR